MQFIVGGIKNVYGYCSGTKAENFMRHLGLTPKGNYFSCYEYAHPFLSKYYLFTATVKIIVTKIVLVIATEEELIIKKIGSGLSPVDIKE